MDVFQLEFVFKIKVCSVLRIVLVITPLIKTLRISSLIVLWQQLMPELAQRVASIFWSL